MQLKGSQWKVRMLLILPFTYGIHLKHANEHEKNHIDIEISLLTAKNYSGL